jgi:hypothetical protein
MVYGVRSVIKALIGNIFEILGGVVMVFNTSFNSISAILWWSVLLVEQTGVPWQTLSRNVVSSTPWHDVEILEHPVYEKNVIWILKYKLNMRM